MSDKMFGVDVNLDFDEKSKPYGWLDKVTKGLEEQAKDLQELGLEIKEIRFTEPDAPARWYVKFPPAKPQWEVRRELDKKGYDVGQKLGLHELTFYVARRRIESKGWTE